MGWLAWQRCSPELLEFLWHSDLISKRTSLNTTQQARKEPEVKLLWNSGNTLVCRVRSPRIWPEYVLLLLWIWAQVLSFYVHGFEWRYDHLIAALVKAQMNWVVLVPAVRYSPCRSRLAVYPVANIDLWYIVRDWNIAGFYWKCGHGDWGEVSFCDVTRFAIEQVVPRYSRGITCILTADFNKATSNAVVAPAVQRSWEIGLCKLCDVTLTGLAAWELGHQVAGI